VSAERGTSWVRWASRRPSIGHCGLETSPMIRDFNVSGRRVLLLVDRWIDEEGVTQVDPDDCGGVPTVGVPGWVRLVGWVAFADVLVGASAMATFSNLCAVAWLMAAMVLGGGCVSLLVPADMGKGESVPPVRFSRACGQGGRSPWEGSGAR
jgi:hypothetical protein